jgi:hypothetical protein
MLWDWQKGGVIENQTYSLYECNNLGPHDGTPEGQQIVADCNGSIAPPFVQNSTFLKLRELRISYELPLGSARSFFGAEGLTITAAGRNLILLTPYWGYDPEVSNFGTQAITRGVDLGPYPPSRVFYFSLSARF